MATKLYEVEGGFSDGNIHYLSGAGAPGGDTGYQDAAPAGSQYVNSSATPPVNYVKRTAGAGSANWAVLVKSDRVAKEFIQTAHGFIAGDWVYRDAGGTFIKGQADDAATSDIIGVVESVAGVNDFTLVSHGFADLASAEAEGSPLFLDTAVAGAATVTKPALGVQKNLGFVIEGKVFVGVGISVEISSTEAPAVPLILTDNITTITNVATIDAATADGAMWVLTATSATGRYQSVINATHDGIGGNPTEVNFTEFAIVDAGAAITGLAIGMALAGADINVTVVSTAEVDVAIRQIQV